MSSDRIDFISAYCDRWCERCAFTQRCSTYAVKIATAMCDGDFRAGLELAVGAPPPEDEEELRRRESFLERPAACQPTTPETRTIEWELGERDERLANLPITTLAATTSTLTDRWLNEHQERLATGGDAIIAEAIDIVRWDCHLIGAKLHRALNGLDETKHHPYPGDDPVQSDWNESAKVALISIDWSPTAWNALARAFGDPDAMAIAEHLDELRTEVERVFPTARRVRRPGFDVQTGQGSTGEQAC